MKKHKPFLVLRAALIMALLLPGLSSGQSTFFASVTTDKYVPGEILVKFKPGISPTSDAGGVHLGTSRLNGLARQYGVTSLEQVFPGAVQSSIGLERIYKLKLSAGANLPSAIEQLAADPNVEYAEPNITYSISARDSYGSDVPSAPVETDAKIAVAAPRSTEQQLGSSDIETDIILAQNLGYAPSIDTFDAQSFLVTQNSRLKSYVISARDGQTLAANILHVAAQTNSVNPRVLLTLLELRANLVSDPNPTKLALAAGYAPNVAPNFQSQVELLAQTLTKAYVAAFTGGVPESITLRSGTRVQLPSGMNAAGYAIITALDTTAPTPLSISDLASSITKFKLIYEGWFGDPFVVPTSVADATLPADTRLPYTGTKSYTGGPHSVGICGEQNIAETSGVDFAGGSFPVLSIAEGKYVGHGNKTNLNPNIKEAGLYVLIEHKGNIQSAYWHLASLSPEIMALTIGDWIPQGFPIGQSGASGNQDAVHLHLDLRQNATTINPYALKIPWDGKTMDGWTIWNLRWPGKVGKAIAYRGSATRGTAKERNITNVTCDQTTATAMVSESYPANLTTAVNKKDGNTAFANYPDSAVLTSTNRLNALTISDAPSFGFGVRHINTNTIKSFTIHNYASTAIGQLSATVGTGPFAFAGGTYPGSGGNCGSSLAANAMCIVIVNFNPTATGVFTGNLEITQILPNDPLPLRSKVTLSGTGTADPQTPNDPLYPQQSALNNTGQNGGKANADIDAPEAWGITTGSANVTVAVIDSGVYYTHDDLNDGRVLTNIDWDYVNNDSDALDDNGHGTHVAGIIAAETNNGIGTAGIMWQAKILPLKVCNEQGACNSDNIAKALRYAADKGARVINLSLGGDCSSQTMADAINYAYFTKKVVVVAAAGNSGESVGYPAAHDPTLAVGATNNKDVRQLFSSTGKQLDLVAPGVNIESSVPRNGHDPMTGTSMAAPHVAGVAGLLIAQRPELTPDQVRDILRQSAQDLGANGFDYLYGYGRVNAFRALQTPTPGTAKAAEQARNDKSCSCAAASTAATAADGTDLLTNVRALRDQVFTQDPGRRWARIYYEHQFSVAWMVASDSALRSDVLAGWREFDPVFQALLDPQKPDVKLTPELIATARRVMMGVADRGNAEVHDLIVQEWQRVDPDRFVDWDVHQVWEQLRRENQQLPQRIYLPMLSSSRPTQ
jgi:murein DD-endopeptidase MepM/ murein hydrolase activator NlpD